MTAYKEYEILKAAQVQSKYSSDSRTVDLAQQYYRIADDCYKKVADWVKTNLPPEWHLSENPEHPRGEFGWQPDGSLHLWRRYPEEGKVVELPEGVEANFHEEWDSEKGVLSDPDRH